MKNLSSKVRSGLINGLLIVVPLLIVLYLGAKGGDMDDTLHAMLHADLKWLLGAFVSAGVFILFETLVLHAFYHFQHAQVPFGTSFITTLIGIFYSCITPAATGGQPMQVVAASKRGISGGQTSSGLAVKFFCFQTSLLLIAVALWLCFPDFVSQHIGHARWFVYTGFLLNGGAVLCVVLLCINPRWVNGFMNALLMLLCKVRIIKKKELWQARLENALHDFSASVRMITHHPFQLLCMLLLSCLQVLGLMSVAYCVYRALGLNQMSYLHILSLQFLLYIGAAFTPLPGSSGAQEGGFYLVFQALFPGDTLLGALLLWRFFTYYLPMLIGLASVICDSLLTLRGKFSRKEEGVPSSSSIQ